MTIDDRILSIEHYLGGVPGTVLARQIALVSGVQWSLMVGHMGGRNREFIGPTIEDVVSQAEAAVTAILSKR